MPVAYRGRTVFMAEPRAAEKRHRKTRRRRFTALKAMLLVFVLCVLAALVTPQKEKEVNITSRPVKGVEIVSTYEGVKRLAVGPHATAFWYKNSSGKEVFERLDRREYMVTVED